MKAGLLASINGDDSRYEHVHKSLIEEKSVSQPLPFSASVDSDAVQWFFVVCETGAVVIEVMLYAEMLLRDVILFEVHIDRDQIPHWELLVRNWYYE